MGVTAITDVMNVLSPTVPTSLMEGYLDLKGSLSWSKRYFILDDKMIYAYKSKSRSKLLETIDLSVGGHVALGDAAMVFQKVPRFAIKLRCGSKNYLLSASTDSTQIQWMTHLQSILNPKPATKNLIPKSEDKSKEAT